MLISVVAIGNSRGIRLPKAILDQLNIEDQIDMIIEDKQLVLKPVNKKPRSGWEESLKMMSAMNEDMLLIPEDSKSTEFEWKW